MAWPNKWTSSIWWLMWKPKGKPAFLAGFYLWLAGPASRWRSTSSRLSASRRCGCFDKPVSFHQLFHPLWITLCTAPPCALSFWNKINLNIQGGLCDCIMSRYKATYKNDNVIIISWIIWYTLMHIMRLQINSYTGFHYYCIVSKRLIHTLNVMKLKSFLSSSLETVLIFIYSNSNFSTISKAIVWMQLPHCDNNNKLSCATEQPLCQWIVQLSS